MQTTLPTLQRGGSSITERSAEQRIATTLGRIRKQTGVSLAFGGLVEDAGLRLSRFDGPVVGPLSGVVLDMGHGLGGKVASLQRPIVVNDYVRAGQITHRYDNIIRAEALRAMIAVPVVVARQTIAVVYGALRDIQPIGDRINDVIVNEARALEQELTVASVLSLNQTATASQLAVENQRLKAAVRDTFGRLRLIAQHSADPELRAAILASADQLAALSAPPPEQMNHAVALTPRERDVLALVAGGLSNPQIGAALGLSTATIKSYLKPLMSKLNAATRHEAVIAARQLGLLP